MAVDKANEFVAINQPQIGFGPLICSCVRAEGTEGDKEAMLSLLDCSVKLLHRRPAGLLKCLFALNLDDRRLEA